MLSGNSDALGLARSLSARIRRHVLLADRASRISDARAPRIYTQLCDPTVDAIVRRPQPSLLIRSVPRRSSSRRSLKTRSDPPFQLRHTGIGAASRQAGRDRVASATSSHRELDGSAGGRAPEPPSGTEVADWTRRPRELDGRATGRVERTSRRAGPQTVSLEAFPRERSEDA